MEVHAHTHAHGKKTWKSYFWEFLMLFLAVFCGFLAENQREHMVEHNREKKYAKTLIEDIINDTAELNRGIPYWENMIANIDTVRQEIEKEASTRNALSLYRCAAQLVSNSNFTYHDRTIGQLKNAGNFRLLQKEVADSLIEYDAKIVSNLKDIEERYTIIYFQNREVLQRQLFNTKFYPLRYDPVQLAAAAKKEPAVIELRKEKEDIVFQYYNSLFSLRHQTVIRIQVERMLLRRAINLIEMIKKGYHLD
jgi:hypothetical protein